MRPQLLLFIFSATLTLQASAAEGYPADVSEFITRRDLCDHFRSEEPYDKARRLFLEKQTNKFCAGTDRQLSRLKSKYQDDARVLNKLNEYEGVIESDKK